MARKVRTRLAHAIAEATGETMTRAVTEALRERYERLRSAQARRRWKNCSPSPRVAAQVKRPYLDHGDLLYDEHGLPK